MVTEPSGKQSILMWSLLVLTFFGVAVAFAIKQQQPPIKVIKAPPIDIRIEIPDFQLTDQLGRTVTRESLLGRPWIADFIFTRCAGPCPLMTQRMSQLQQALSDVESLHLVSFSVDPTRDTPQVLRRYAEDHGADHARWLFLTGDMDTIYDLAISGFKIAVEQARETNQIIHDSRFILVDSAGQIRGYYDSGQPQDLDALTQDARRLAGTGQ